jgi:glutamyl-tRNA synthetase
MRITHVLRGEDLLPSTPRQIALYRALIAIGVTDTLPRFGHLPYVTGEGNKKLSKRDPTSSLNLYRQQGYLPEGLLNYLALLGWSIADDRDVFSLDEMVAAFDVADVNANPARFDPKKCEAINAAHIRLLPPDEFAVRLRSYADEIGTKAPAGVIESAAPLVQERIRTLREGLDLIHFLLVAEADFTVDEDTAVKQLDGPGHDVVSAALATLETVSDWTAGELEQHLNAVLVQELGLKPRQAYGPVRVAVTGRAVSPPLFESLELLGRDRTLARLRAARDR